MKPKTNRNNRKVVKPNSKQSKVTRKGNVPMPSFKRLLKTLASFSLY